VSILQLIKELVPYKWKKDLLDLVRPNRPGIGPVLHGMNRDLETVFDIGANVGDISLLMLYYFPKATVYSFEPCSATHDMLVNNIAKSDYSGRSRPFRLGFFDEEKEATLNITSFHGANSMLEMTEEYQNLHPHIEKVKTEQISLMRLDDFVSRHNIDHIDLVKIDVEGVEQQILNGGAETFSRKVDSVVMEMSFFRNPRESGEFINLFQIMHNYGFAPAEIYDLDHVKDSDKWKLVQFDCVFRRF
jgi:FkbM family methyltransferase